MKKKNRPLLTQFFSPIFLKTFYITVLGEWDDKSQVNINSEVFIICNEYDFECLDAHQMLIFGLAAAENPLGVVLGGISASIVSDCCLFGGKSLATHKSERFVALSGGVLFIVFGIQSFFSTIES
ncbi:Uncharacterized protein family UPF0016, partial [Cynara cardunculus var. scolymus]